MSQDIGRKHWAIADGYIPAWSHGPKPEFESHDTACILNTSAEEARVTVTVYFSDRGPAGPFRLTVPAQRTKHLRFNDLTDPESIPRGVDYAAVVVSSAPVVVQHTRLDSRQADNALFSTVAYSDD